MNPIRIIIALAAGMVGVGFFAGAWWAYNDTAQLRSVADRVPGRIVSFSTRPSSNNHGNTYAPVFQFVYHGENRLKESNISTSGRPEIGKEVTLLVDPHNPSKVKADTFMGQWFMPMILGAFGAVFLLGAFAAATASEVWSRAMPAPQSPLGVPDEASTSNALSTDAAPEPPSLPKDGRSGPFL